MAVDATGDLFIADFYNNVIFKVAGGEQKIDIAKAHLTVIANSQSKTFGSANPTLSSQVYGFVNGDTASVVSGAPTLSTTATSDSGVGTYAISVAVGTLSASDYDFAYLGAGTLTVTPAPLVVSAVNQVIAQGQALPTLTVSYSGFVNGDTVASLTTAPSVTTTATTSSPAGTYPITPSGGSDPNYQLIDLPGTLVVTLGAERMYRLYNPANGDHIYTNSLGEFDTGLQFGLHDETTGNVGWGVFPTQLPGTLPVHRVYLASAGLHYYTLSDGERNSLVAAGWKSEGDEGYLYPTAQPGTTEVFHVYNTVAGIHFFTSSTAELNALVATPGNLLQQQTSLGFGVAFAAGSLAASSGASQAPEIRADLSAGVSANPLAGLTAGAAATGTAAPGGNAVAVAPVAGERAAGECCRDQRGGLGGRSDPTRRDAASTVGRPDRRLLVAGRPRPGNGNRESFVGIASGLCQLSVGFASCRCSVFSGNLRQGGRGWRCGLKGRFCQHRPEACDSVGTDATGPERAVQRALFEWARHGERPFQGRRAAGAL